MNTKLSRLNRQAERSDGPNGPRSRTRSHPCARAEQRSGRNGNGNGVGNRLGPSLRSASFAGGHHGC